MWPKPAFGDPDRMSNFVNAPNTQAGDYGAKHTNSTLSYIKGDPQSELTFTRMGSHRHVTLHLTHGSVHLGGNAGGSRGASKRA